jgi:hypothetical protein
MTTDKASPEEPLPTSGDDKQRRREPALEVDRKSKESSPNLTDESGSTS